jgi:hypothetical protein
MQAIKNTFAFTAISTTATNLLCENGFVRQYVLTVPNFTNAVTATVSVLDEDSNTIYTGSAHNRNATYSADSLSVPCDKNYTAKVTLSGAAGGSGGDVTLKLYVEHV